MRTASCCGCDHDLGEVPLSSNDFFTRNLSPHVLLSARLRLHVFGESISVANALEQSSTPGASRCSQAFMDALGIEPSSLPGAVREVPPLAGGPTASQRMWELS